MTSLKHCKSSIWFSNSLLWSWDTAFYFCNNIVSSVEMYSFLLIVSADSPIWCFIWGVVWFFIVSSSSIVLTPSGFHILSGLSLAPHLCWSQTREVSWLKAPLPRDSREPWVTEAPHTVLCVYVLATWAFHWLGNTVDVNSQFAFPAPQRYGFFTRARHRLGDSLQRPSSLLCALPPPPQVHLACWLPGPVGSSFPGAPYMEKQPFVPQLLLGVPFLAHAERSPLPEAPLGCRSLRFLGSSGIPSLRGLSSLLGFWHLGVSLSSQLRGAFYVFFTLFYPVF